MRNLKTELVQGKVVQALQCAQRHQLTSVDPEAFLSKAAETGVSLNKFAAMTATVASSFVLFCSSAVFCSP